MKVFVCRVKKTTVEEAVMYVEVPDRKAAMDPEWLVFADEYYDTFEEYNETSVTRKILSATQITTLSGIPKSDHDVIPYNMPDREPKEVRSLKDLLRPEEKDEMQENSDVIKVTIKTLEDEIIEIKKRIGEFNAMLSKCDGKAKS